MFGIESNKKSVDQYLSEEDYKIKYLKYKNKYMELKQSGGIGSPTGILCFFTSNEKANEIVELFKTKKVPKFDTLSEIMHNNGYYITEGSDQLELMVKPKKIASFFGKKTEEPKEELKQNKVKLPKTKVFNRCDMNHVQDVKDVLGAYGFKPEAMIVILLKTVGSDVLITEKPVTI